MKVRSYFVALGVTKYIAGKDLRRTSAELLVCSASEAPFD